jgi:hypothetical protein
MGGVRRQLVARSRERKLPSVRVLRELSRRCLSTIPKYKRLFDVHPTHIIYEVNMRRVLILSAALIAAACSDNQQPTSPANGRSVSVKASAANEPSSSAQAKPTDQVGFTKVTRVFSDNITVPAGQEGQAVATCPPGSVLTGGGYTLNYQTLARVVQSHDDAANGWRVFINNSNLATPATVLSYAYCAS